MSEAGFAKAARDLRALITQRDRSSEALAATITKLKGGRNHG